MSLAQQKLHLIEPELAEMNASSPDFFLKKYGSNHKLNKLAVEDQPVHAWYRFVLSYPPHLVRDYLQSFGATIGSTLLDPFCGTGTTIVEAKKLGIPSVGIESHPMAYLASKIKTDWRIDPELLIEHAFKVSKTYQRMLPKSFRTLSDEKMKLLLKDCISPDPLNKSLALIEAIELEKTHPFYDVERVALAKALVFSISNLHFGPEVGVRGYKEDADVLNHWLAEVGTIAADLKVLKENRGAETNVHHADAREMKDLLKPASINYVITSPPYPNEKDYTRTTRLETVLLGLASTKEELRALKKGLIRSNTRGIYKTDDDDLWVANHPEIQRIAAEIEARRIELNKTSGFERMYARATKLYFGGMARHFADLRKVLAPGAKLAYVVGDQASYLRVMIRTGQILGDIAESLGYKVESIDLFRTRIATATKEQLREEVLVLHWPGNNVESK